MKIVKYIILLVLLCGIGFGAFYVLNYLNEKKILEEIISRLTAESRVAEVKVIKKVVDPLNKKTYTTVEFIEYDIKQKALEPKYFTFSTDVIYFEALVIRFEDFYIKKGHPLKGKSAYIFTKAFAFVDKDKVETFLINKIYSIPTGYKIDGVKSKFEEKLWQKFWYYALEPNEAKKVGIKSVQIEAPATKFVEGLLYTLKIEHDGGLRIDVKKL